MASRYHLPFLPQQLQLLQILLLVAVCFQAKAWAIFAPDRLGKTAPDTPAIQH